jgi:hypothetical protein
VDEVQGGGIELLVNKLPWLQVVQVLGSWMKSLLNDSPKLYRHKVNVRAHVILPIGKARSTQVVAEDHMRQGVVFGGASWRHSS